jgi:hypothetical protein
MSLLPAIVEEIRAGLGNSRDRRDEAGKNLEFYRADFRRYPPRPKAESNADGSPRDPNRRNRTVPFSQRVVNLLTAALYKRGPTRSMPDHPDASAWLETAYKCGRVNSLLRQADRYAILGDVAAIQVEGTTDPDDPVRFLLWDAASFEAWADRDDPKKMAAVATIDCVDQRRRARLWTPEWVITFESEKVEWGQTANGRTLKQVGPAVPNPYGVVPFAFVHFDVPLDEFWTPSPGDLLTEANDYLNAFLTAMGDRVEFAANPILLAAGVRAGWKPGEVRPGAVWDLASAKSAGDEGADPDLSYLQADLGFIEAGWGDLQNYLDLLLETLGVPPAAIRLVQTTSASGVAIMAEQIPLLEWAEGRQELFGLAEHDLAVVTLKVASAWLAANKGTHPQLEATSAQLAAAAKAPGLVLGWPDLFEGLKTEARLALDTSELEEGLTSRIQVLMRRLNLTRDEAREHLRQIAEDRAFEAVLLSPPAVLLDPSKPKPTTPPPAVDDDGDQVEDTEP